MGQTFMKERPILPLMLSMSLPMVLSMLVNSLYNIVDSFFVAQISESAMTALSLVYPIQNFINAIAIGFGIGINAVIAVNLGAQNHEKADAAASQGVLLNTIHGLIMTVISIAVMPDFLRMFTSDSVVIELGISYSRIAFGFATIIAVELCFEKIFQAAGKMTATMVAMLSGSIANIILDPILIFGLGPVPELGIKGAAIATGAGQVLTLIIFLAIYYSQEIPVHVRFQDLKPDKEICKKLYSVGIPATLNMALPSLLVSSLNAILAAYSQAYVVVLGVYYKLQTFLYLPANGIVQGMRPIIGYNYGAKETKRVKKIYRTALILSASIMLLGTAICLAIPGQLIGLFTTNPQTIEAGTSALRIISAGFIVSAVSVTSAGALEGLGMGTPSLLISILRYVVIIIPCAFILSRLIGVTGVWNAFWVSELVTAIVAYRMFAIIA